MNAEHENHSDIDEDNDYVFGPVENAPVQVSSVSGRESSPEAASQDDTNEENAVGPGNGEDLTEDERIEKVSEDEAKNGRRREEHRKHVLAESFLRKNQRYYLSKKSVIKYRSLLNDIYIDAVYNHDKLGEESSGINTKLGLVKWTNIEEDRFFTALSRLGKNNIRQIARAVGSKSQLEVQEYIRVLQYAVEETAANNEEDLLKQTGIPAAAEISEGLEGALDRFATHISILDQNSDMLEGRKKYGHEFWLIDSKTAETIEMNMKSDDVDSSQSGIFQVAELFHMKQWIKLSENLFMNSGTSNFEGNWRNIAFKDESPSLTADAFTEFYMHAVSIIQNLVKVSHLFAQDRLARVLHAEREKYVRKEDVLKTLTILNMKTNSSDHFIGAARRLRLDVAHISNKRGKQNRYISYDDVEEILSRRRPYRSANPSADKSGGDGLDSSDNEDEADSYSSAGISEEEEEEGEGEGQEPENDEGGDGTVKSDENDQALSSVEETDKPSDMETDNEDGFDHEVSRTQNENSIAEDEMRIDEYLDYIDQKASKNAERSLRAMLPCPEIDKLPPIVKAESEFGEIPSAPTAKRIKDSTPDWRDEIVYRAEWEAFGASLPEIDRAIARNHGKRRRVD